MQFGPHPINLTYAVNPDGTCTARHRQRRAVGRRRRGRRPLRVPDGRIRGGLEPPLHGPAPLRALGRAVYQFSASRQKWACGWAQAGHTFGRLAALVDVPAVQAVPDLLELSTEDEAGFDVAGQGEVALLVVLLGHADGIPDLGDVLEALLASHLGEAGVELGPLVVLAGRGRDQVLLRGLGSARRKRRL